MSKTIRVLLLSALFLFGAGSLVCYRGAELNGNMQNEDQTLWGQQPGDKWLYAGGLMILISGALALAAIKVWSGTRRELASPSRRDSRDRRNASLSRLS